MEHTKKTMTRTLMEIIKQIVHGGLLSFCLLLNTWTLKVYLNVTRLTFCSSLLYACVKGLLYGGPTGG